MGCSAAGPHCTMKIDESLRNYLVRAAQACNSPDSEAAVHDVIVKVLVNNTELRYPRTYLANAVRNQVRSQQRQIKQRRTIAMADSSKMEAGEYPGTSITTAVEPDPESHLISHLDLAAWMNRNIPIPGQGVPEAPREPIKKNSDRKDLETVGGYEQISRPTSTQRARVHHARRRLQKSIGPQLQESVALH